MMMDIMIPKLSMSSDDTDDVAFKVLNQDDLPTIAVVGETIFKPFGNDPRAKPNLIVHPTRRIITNLEDNKQKGFAKSHGNISINTKRLKKKLSNSHGQLDHNNSSTGIKVEDFNSQVDSRFTRTLDAKLRRLQREEKQSTRKIHYQEKPRKPFVTTVPKGTFLEPPSELEKLAAKEAKIQKEDDKFKKEEVKKLFTYSSQPRVLNRAPAKFVHVQKCTAALAAARIAGGVAGFGKGDEIHQEINNDYGQQMPCGYGNIMSDKRVFRGSTFSQLHLPKWNPHFAYAKLLSRDAAEGETAVTRAAEARRRALARRKAKCQQLRTGPNRLTSPPKIDDRHIGVQTESYLEEIYAEPPVESVHTQTEMLLERPLSPFYVPAKSGVDAGTQIYSGDLFDFDMEVQPVLEILVGQTIEQALIEVLEEEELAALREQQRSLLEMQAAGMVEPFRSEDREIRLAEQTEYKNEEQNGEVKLKIEKEGRAAASTLMQNLMKELLPSVITSMEKEGVIVNDIKEDVDGSFMPWLVNEVTQEITDVVCSKDVLSDIIREILDNRTEIYKALNQDNSLTESDEGPTEDIILQLETDKFQKEDK